MMKVGDVCSRLVIDVTQDEDVRRAAELMRKYHVGYLVVTEYGDEHKVPVGVITDRDIVVEVVAKAVTAEELTVGDIMTELPLVASEGDDISETLDAMRGKGVRRVPVVDSKRSLIGVLAIDDLLQVLASDISTVASIVGSQRRQESEVRG